MFLHFGRNLTVVAYANLTIAKDISPACTLISPINACKNKKLFRILPNSSQVWAVRLFPERLTAATAESRLQS